MRIPTLKCQNCGTIIAGNVLESNRLMKCPRLNCERELRFADLPKSDRRHVENNRKEFKAEE